MRIKRGIKIQNFALIRERYMQTFEAISIPVHKGVPYGNKHLLLSKNSHTKHR